jgi:hypothetical protein
MFPEKPSNPVPGFLALLSLSIPVFVWREENTTCIDSAPALGYKETRERGNNEKADKCPPLASMCVEQQKEARLSITELRAASWQNIVTSSRKRKKVPFQKNASKGSS